MTKYFLIFNSQDLDNSFKYYKNTFMHRSYYGGIIEIYKAEVINTENIYATDKRFCYYKIKTGQYKNMIILDFLTYDNYQDAVIAANNTFKYFIKETQEKIDKLNELINKSKIIETENN